MNKPLTPPDCDLRDFGFMPLDVVRFRQSDLVTQEDPEAIVAAILLWGAAWHSVPAASLTDNDRSLAQQAGFGRAIDAFLRVKDAALKGFIKCDDGRLYHPVVAEKALDAWQGKLLRKWRTECARVRKHNERYKNQPEEQQEAPTFEQFMSQRRHADVTRDINETGEMSHATKEEVAALAEQIEPELIESDVQKADNKSKTSMSRATTRNVTSDIDPCHANVAREMPSKGQGEGEGQGQGDSIDITSTSSLNKNGVETKNPLDGDDDILTRVSELGKIAGLNLTRPEKLANALDQLREWLGEGIDFERDILPTIKARSADNPSETVHSLRYFDAAVRKRFGLSSQGISPPKPLTPPKPKDPIAAVDGSDERVAEFRARLTRTVGPRVYNNNFAPEHCAIEIEDSLVRLRFRSDAEATLAESRFGDVVATAARGMSLAPTMGALKS